MTKNLLTRIALIACSVLILTGASLSAYFLISADQKQIVKVEIEDSSVENGVLVPFEKLGLAPGENCGYTLVVDVKDTSQYDLTLAFYEKADGALADYARVRIEVNKEVLRDQLLSELFEDNVLTLHVDLRGKKRERVKITYYLPAEIGNEAQETEAFFELLVSAKSA